MNRQIRDDSDSDPDPKYGAIFSCKYDEIFPMHVWLLMFALYTLILSCVGIFVHSRLLKPMRRISLVKVAIDSIQIISIIILHYGADQGFKYSAAYGLHAFLLDLSFLSIWKCTYDVQTFRAFNLITPVAIMFWLSFIMTVMRMYEWKVKSVLLRSDWVRMRNIAYGSVIGHAIFQYVGLSYSSFFLWHEIKNPVSTSETMKAVVIFCSSSVYGLLIPLGTIYLIRKHRQQAFLENYIIQLSAWTAPYQPPHHIHFELFSILRKIGISAVAVFLQGQPTYQLSASGAVIVAWILLQLKACPYQSRVAMKWDIAFSLLHIFVLGESIGVHFPLFILSRRQSNRSSI
eukprot:TRINITY_DN5236_c0_g1_i5.p1 TRINITY_DN5236_c0_g1~~TRINITY_DN5236_c0_g1_i5.p1  ORF type:complete len:345 (-),score=46.35 TRINITY_DN5236_c0_g1_i5:541-1575(-)